MGGALRVGRVSGLAVALGIGAAVFAGQGVASATPSDASGSEPSTASSSTDSSTGSPGTRSTPSADTSPSSPSSTSEKPSATTDSDASEDTPKRKKRTRAGFTPSTPSQNDSRATESTGDTTPRALSVQTEAAVKADEPSAVVAQTPSVSTPAATVDVVIERARPEPVTGREPEEAVTVAVSGAVSALVSPFAGDGDAPTAPVGSPVAWTLAAAARRELSAPLALTATAGPVSSPLAIPQTPLLAPLQQLPIVAPMFVTPIVAVIKQVPFVGDILHPLIGYPLGLTGGTTPRDVKVISFDGTPIYVHFFPAQGVAQGMAAPTILNGPGLALPGETNPTAEDNPFLPNQVIGMAPLLRNGYNVVTWDPRGEWSSGGRLEIDHPDFEGRDVQAIISWLAAQPEAALDAPGDPRIGMVGASYGGGIQLVTAAIDPRVDAIVPTIAWNNLNTSLYKSQATKTSWGALLTAALLFTGARVNPQIYTAVATGLLTGALTQADQDFLDARSPTELLDDITAPTLLVQGTVDTLFTLQEAHENAIVLIGNEVPTKVVWYCGGHGGCITSTNDGTVIERATMQWLDRHVKGLSVDTGPQFEWVDQYGQQFSSDTYPIRPGTSLSASSDAGGSLLMVPFLSILGGSGPNLRGFDAGLIGGLLGILSGTRASHAVELAVPPATTTTYLMGAPELTLTYSGAGSSRHVYAQLVDDATGLVLGNLVTPVPVTLDGQTHTVRVRLEQVAHTLLPGQTVTLQLVASAVSYQMFLSSGRLNVVSMQLTLPTADVAAVSGSFAGLANMV